MLRGTVACRCCGVTGAGLAGTFEPLQSYFLGATFVFVTAGHVLVRREERRACEPGTPCANPTTRRRMKWAIWLATATAGVAGSSGMRERF